MEPPAPCRDEKATGQLKSPKKGLHRPKRPQSASHARKVPSSSRPRYFEPMAGHCHFSSLDLEQSFLRLRFYPPHKENLSFAWRSRRYMFVGMLFLLTPTSAVLQRTMTRIFRNLPRIISFQDDVTVESDNFQQHLDDLMAAIDALTSAHLRLRFFKCSFSKAPFTSWVTFLGRRH